MWSFSLFILLYLSFLRSKHAPQYFLPKCTQQNSLFRVRWIFTPIHKTKKQKIKIRGSMAKQFSLRLIVFSPKPNLDVGRPPLSDCQELHIHYICSYPSYLRIRAMRAFVFLPSRFRTSQLRLQKWAIFQFTVKTGQDCRISYSRVM
jgi:hypothetical protein